MHLKCSWVSNACSKRSTEAIARQVSPDIIDRVESPESFTIPHNQKKCHKVTLKHVTFSHHKTISQANTVP